MERGYLIPYLVYKQIPDITWYLNQDFSLLIVVE